MSTGTAEPDVVPPAYAFLEAYPDAIAIHRDGFLLYVNRAGAELVGATNAAELIGRSVLDFVHPDSRQLVIQRLQDTVAGQPADLLDERFITLSGEPIDVEVVALPVNLEGGPATQLIVRNVTALRRAQRENARLAAEAASAEARHAFAVEALELAERAAGLGVWDWDITTNALRWTNGLEPLHGMEPGTFRGTFEHFLEAVYEPDRPVLMNAIETALSPGSSDEFEARMRVQHPEELRWILGKGRVFRDEAGNPLRMVGIGLDVTERTSIELALAERETLLRLVTGLLPANVAYFDAALRYRFVNETYREWFNIEPSSVLGQGAAEFMGKRAFSIVEPSLRRALAGERSELRMDIKKLSGGRRYLHAQYVPDVAADGSVKGVVALINDVTALHTANAELESRAQAQQLFGDLGAALQQCLDVTECSETTANMLVEGFGLGVAIDRFEPNGTRRLAAATADPELLKAAEIIAAEPLSGPAHPPPLRTVPSPLANDPQAIALQVGIPVKGMVGGVLTVVGPHALWGADDRSMFQDVAGRLGLAIERIELIQRLEAALSAREDFIGFTTHELKTPLTVVLGFADVLSRRAGDLEPATIIEIAGLLNREAHRLEEIIENMLALARAERGSEDEPALLHRLAQKVLNQRRWRHTARPREVRVTGDPGLLLAPAGWLEQVIENLVSNAEKYSDAETLIEVEVADEGSFVRLSVLDRGRGVSDEQSVNLFEPFFRANPLEPGVPGIGLGLTVCRKLIARLGGEIWLRPRPGGGTDAGFRVPVAEPHSEL